jgi:hypothetical protein
VKTFTNLESPLSVLAGLLVRAPRWIAALGGAAQVDGKITLRLYVTRTNRFTTHGLGYPHGEVTTYSELLHSAIAAIENSVLGCRGLGGSRLMIV